MTVTIKDIARRVGVSSATVSRVLSEKPHVSEELRKRVLATMEELSYNPNRVARSLRVQRTSIIGLIISDIQNPFFTSLVRAVEDVANAHQYAIFLCNSDENIDKEKLYIELMQAENVAGVIISPSQEQDDPCLELLKNNIPLVIVDRRLAGVEVDTVLVDNVQGAFCIVDHLLTDGHTRIGAVLGVPTATTGRERYEGYIQALAAHHLSFQPELLRTGIPQEAIGYRLAQDLLDLTYPPTAFFSGNNLLTMGVLRAIHERGLRIPDDIALVAFDEMSWMSIFTPGLTVAAQPTYELGQTAAQLLLQRIADGTRPTQEVLLQTTLHIRQSCGYHLERMSATRGQSDKDCIKQSS
ncbi:MAG: LacI family DNA-binding transcriptional regulator [Ktedonobacteraceae bacterium]